MSDPIRFYFDEGVPVIGTPLSELNLGNGREGQVFELLDVKWGNAANGTTGGQVTWSIASTNLGIEPSEFSGPMPTFFMDDVRAAFDAWEAVADIDFVEVEDGPDVNIRIGMGELDGPGQPGQSNTVGTAFYSFSQGRFIQAHIVMDVDDYNSPGDQTEFFLTALHEIGHAIGLDHEDDVPAIMASFVDSSLSGLTSDDIAGVQAIYGASESVDEPNSGPAPGISVSEGTTDALDTTATTDNLISGDTFNGTLSTSEDKDWVSIELTAGTQYTFDLRGAGSGVGTLEDGFLVLRNSTGGFAAQDDNSGLGSDARLVFTPNSSGTYYISVRTFGIDGGTYSLVTSPQERTEDGDGSSTPPPDTGTIIPGITVSEGNTDAPASTATSYSLISGDSFEGELSSSFDRDWVAIDLTVGTEYTFDLKGVSDGGGTLNDPLLVLRNVNGGFVTQDDDSGAGLNSQIVFTPDSSGTYYLSARGFDGDTGTYTLTTSPNERTDESGGTTPTPEPGGQTIAEGDTDAAGDTSTTAQMSVGDTFEGELSTAGDRDFVSINLTAGTEYTFWLQGADSGNGNTLPDPFLIIRDDGGAFVVQDDNSGTGLDSLITFTPSTTGTYFLSVRNFTGDTGTYTLIASDNTGSAAQQAEAESGIDMQKPGEGYVTSADAADMVVLINEAGLSS